MSYFPSKGIYNSIDLLAFLSRFKLVIVSLHLGIGIHTGCLSGLELFVIYTHQQANQVVKVG